MGAVMVDAFCPLPEEVERMPKIVPVLIASALVLALVSACGEPPEAPPKSWNWQRIDAAGHIMSAADPEPHRCVLDRQSGLMWQVHNQSGDPTDNLGDADNRYSWFSTDRQRHMSEPGLADGGQCSGSQCDTQALVEAVNRKGLCGHRDWRMPDRAELMTLGDARLRPTGLIVDPAFFPGVVAGEYWTAETFRLYPQSAWAVDFGNGLDRADLKTEAKSVRLVRRHAAPTGEE